MVPTALPSSIPQGPHTLQDSPKRWPGTIQQKRQELLGRMAIGPWSWSWPQVCSGQYSSLLQSPPLTFPQVSIRLRGPGPYYLTFVLACHASETVLVSTGNRSSKTTQVPLQLPASSSLFWRGGSNPQGQWQPWGGRVLR